MNTNIETYGEMIKNIAKIRDEKNAAYRKDIEDKTADATAAIKGLAGRVSRLLELKNICQDNKISLPYEFARGQYVEGTYTFQGMTGSWGAAHYIRFHSRTANLYVDVDQDGNVTRITNNIYNLSGKDKLEALTGFVNCFDKFEDEFLDYIKITYEHYADSKGADSSE